MSYGDHDSAYRPLMGLRNVANRQDQRQSNNPPPLQGNFYKNHDDRGSSYNGSTPSYHSHMNYGVSESAYNPSMGLRDVANKYELRKSVNDGPQGNFYKNYDDRNYYDKAPHAYTSTNPNRNSKSLLEDLYSNKSSYPLVQGPDYTRGHASASQYQSFSVPAATGLIIGSDESAAKLRKKEKQEEYFRQLEEQIKQSKAPIDSLSTSRVRRRAAAPAEERVSVNADMMEIMALRRQNDAQNQSIVRSREYGNEMDVSSISNRKRFSSVESGGDRGDQRAFNEPPQAPYEYGHYNRNPPAPPKRLETSYEKMDRQPPMSRFSYAPEDHYAQPPPLREDRNPTYDAVGPYNNHNGGYSKQSSHPAFAEERRDMPQEFRDDLYRGGHAVGEGGGKRGGGGRGDDMTSYNEGAGRPRIAVDPYDGGGRNKPSHDGQWGPNSPSKSPGLARQRMLSDVYGTQVVGAAGLGEDWRPSNLGFDEKEKKRAAMEQQKELLKQQVEEGLRIKERELLREKEEEDKLDRKLYTDLSAAQRSQQGSNPRNNLSDEARTAREMQDKNLREALERKFGKHGAALRWDREMRKRGIAIAPADYNAEDTQDPSHYSPSKAMGRDRPPAAVIDIMDIPIRPMGNVNKGPSSPQNDIPIVMKGKPKDLFKSRALNDFTDAPRREATPGGHLANKSNLMSFNDEDETSDYNDSFNNRSSHHHSTRNRTSGSTTTSVSAIDGVDAYVQSYKQKYSQPPEQNLQRPTSNRDVSFVSDSKYMPVGSESAPKRPHTVEESLTSESLMMYSTDPSVLFGNTRGGFKQSAYDRNIPYSGANETVESPSKSIASLSLKPRLISKEEDNRMASSQMSTQRQASVRRGTSRIEPVEESHDDEEVIIIPSRQPMNEQAGRRRDNLKPEHGRDESRELVSSRPTSAVQVATTRVADPFRSSSTRSLSAASRPSSSRVSLARDDSQQRTKDEMSPGASRSSSRNNLGFAGENARGSSLLAPEAAKSSRIDTASGASADYAYRQGSRGHTSQKQGSSYSHDEFYDDTGDGSSAGFKDEQYSYKPSSDQISSPRAISAPSRRAAGDEGLPGYLMGSANENVRSRPTSRAADVATTRVADPSRSSSTRSLSAASRPSSSRVSSARDDAQQHTRNEMSPGISRSTSSSVAQVAATRVVVDPPRPSSTRSLSVASRPSSSRVSSARDDAQLHTRGEMSPGMSRSSSRYTDDEDVTRQGSLSSFSRVSSAQERPPTGGRVSTRDLAHDSVEIKVVSSRGPVVSNEELAPKWTSSDSQPTTGRYSRDLESAGVSPQESSRPSSRISSRGQSGRGTWDTSDRSVQAAVSVMSRRASEVGEDPNVTANYEEENDEILDDEEDRDSVYESRDQSIGITLDEEFVNSEEEDDDELYPDISEKDPDMDPPKVAPLAPKKPVKFSDWEDD